MKRRKPAVALQVFTLIAFFISIIVGPVNVFADTLLQLPQPGTLVGLSPAFSPLLIKGLKINRKNPFQFDFIVNQGQENLPEAQFRQESLKLVRYFLASLAIPEDDLWVNLSPYEKNRITTPELKVTEMGRDLLAQDYLLKQITSSLIYPEGETGKRFWAKVYALAQEKYGTTNIPVNTFNKVWIVPAKAVVYENSTSETAFVVESKLKVLLEEDYLALKKHSPSVIARSEATKQSFNTHSIGSQIVREIVLPELTKEINEGKNFANLRQITNSLILAAWFKKMLRASILGQLYVDRKKTSGVDLEDQTITERIYQQYLKAYKKGVYNYIREEEDPATHEVVPRKYFSGGFFGHVALDVESVLDPAQLAGEAGDRAVTVSLFSPAPHVAAGFGKVSIEEFNAVDPSGGVLRILKQKRILIEKAGWISLNDGFILRPQELSDIKFDNIWQRLVEPRIYKALLAIFDPKRSAFLRDNFRRPQPKISITGNRLEQAAHDIAFKTQQQHAAYQFLRTLPIGQVPLSPANFRLYVETANQAMTAEEINAAKIRRVFSSLYFEMLKRFRDFVGANGPLDTAEKQKKFADENSDYFQTWILEHKREIIEILPLIPSPGLNIKYKRSKYFSDDDERFGSTSLWIHRARVNSGTGKHFHGFVEWVDGKPQKVGEMAFAVALQPGLSQVRYPYSNHLPGTLIINNLHPERTFLEPFKVAVIIDEHLGAHGINYKAVGDDRGWIFEPDLRGGAFLEFYAGPKPMSRTDTLYDYGEPHNNELYRDYGDTFRKDIVIRNARVELLYLRNSILGVAQLENWRPISLGEAHREILNVNSPIRVSHYRELTTTYFYDLDNPKGSYVLIPEPYYIEHALNDINHGKGYVLQRPAENPAEQNFLIVRGNSAMISAPLFERPDDIPLSDLVRVMTSDEIKKTQEDPNYARSILFKSSDGLIRKLSYNYSRQGAQDIINRKNLNQKLIVVIGAGPHGLSQAEHLIHAGYKVIVVTDKVFPIYTNGGGPFNAQRSAAFRSGTFSLEGFDPQEEAAIHNMVSALPEYRSWALAGRRVLNNVRQFIGLAPGHGDEKKLSDAALPAAKPELWMYGLRELAWLNSNPNGLVIEGATLAVHPQFNPDTEKWQITLSNGLVLEPEELFVGTGFVGRNAQYEKVPDILKALSDDQFTKLFTTEGIDTPNRITPAGLDEKPFVITSSNVVDPVIEDYIRHLKPVNGAAPRILLAGGGLSAGNVIAYVHGINPWVEVIVVTEEGFSVYPSQIQKGFRHAASIWRTILNENDRQRSLKVWKSEQNSFGSPVTPSVYEHIKNAENSGTLIQKTGVHFTNEDFTISRTPNGILIARKPSEIQSGYSFEVNGIISAAGYDFKVVNQGLVDFLGKNNLGLTPRGNLDLDAKDFFLSRRNHHLFIIGASVLNHTIKTSYHSAAIVSRIITYFLTHRNTLPPAELEDEQLVEKITGDYSSLDPALPEEAKQSIVLAANQPGSDLNKALKQYNPNAPKPPLSREAIIDRVFKTDQPHQTEASINRLFDDPQLNAFTQGSLLAKEQLLYPLAQFGTKDESDHVFSLYKRFRNAGFSIDTAAFLTRASRDYFPPPFDEAMAVNLPVSKLGDQGVLGAIDLNMANLRLVAKVKSDFDFFKGIAGQNERAAAFLTVAANQPGKTDLNIADRYRGLRAKANSPEGAARYEARLSELSDKEIIDKTFTGETRVLLLYHLIENIINYEDPIVPALLIRAATSYIKTHEDRAQRSVVSEKKLDPGGIDLNTANLDFQIKHDSNGFALPVSLQDMAMIHIDGLSPVIVAEHDIPDLQEFLTTP